MSSVWLTASAVRYITCKLLRPGQPRVLRGLGPEVEDAAPFLLGHGADDPRAVARLGRRADADDLGQVFLRLFGRTRVEHQRAAELNLVAALQLVLADALAVDERAVAAVQIGDRVVVVDAADFGVVAGDFGVVKLERVRGVPPEPNGRLGQLEAAALVGSADDEQRRHGLFPLLSLASNSSILRIRGP